MTSADESTLTLRITGATSERASSYCPDLIFFSADPARLRLSVDAVVKKFLDLRIPCNLNLEGLFINEFFWRTSPRTDPATQIVS